MGINTSDGEENFENLLEDFTSVAQINAAKRDKEANDTQSQIAKKQSKKPPKKPQAKLDLHMRTIKESLMRIDSFVRESKRKRLKTIQIVTGKGIHSNNGISKLKGPVLEKIQELQNQGIVAGYKWSTVTREWSGAIIVYLT